MTPAESAYQLLKTTSLENTCPVPLQTLLSHLGFKAQLFPQDERTRNLSCGVNFSEKLLFANALDPAPEQRYAFAHAIGHVVLHPGNNRVDRRQHLHHAIESPMEAWEANQFADALLMDSRLFALKWEELRGDLSRLASAWVVPKERLIVRAKALGLW
jgi:Zn-dependent peptidase ImmA (M78 family)